jgi:hypothetical protein
MTTPRNPKLPRTLPSETTTVGARPQNPQVDPARTESTIPAPAPSPNPSPTQPPETSPRPRPTRPPPPRIERRPLGQAAPVQVATPPAVEGGGSKRPLPVEPEQREAALRTVDGLTDTILGMFSSLIERWTPTKPLTKVEQETIRAPLRIVLWESGGDIPAEWQLAFAAGVVVLPRYLETREAKPPVKTAGEMAAEMRRVD